MTYETAVPSTAAINALAGSNGYRVLSTFSGSGGSSLGYRWAGFKLVGALEFVQEAVDSYLANFPETPVLVQDVRQATGADLLKLVGLKVGELDVLDGSPPCFVAGTLILTKRGLVPIEEVTLGDEVLTHKNRWRRVIECHNCGSETIIVEGQGINAIRTTAEHPFYVRRQVRLATGTVVRGRSEKFRHKGKLRRDTIWKSGLADPEWVQASNLSPNGVPFHHKASKRYYWAAPAELPQASIPAIDCGNRRSHKFNIDADFFQLVGRWLGDGWLRTDGIHNGTRSRGELIICCGKHEFHELAEMIKRVVGDRFSFCEMQTSFRFAICSKPLAIWLEKHFGRLASGKTIPSWALGMDRDLRQALLLGYLSADGSDTDYGWKASTVSRKLAVGLRLLAASLGMPVNTSLVNRNPSAIIEGRTVKQRPAYCISIYAGTEIGKTTAEFADSMIWTKVRKAVPTGLIEQVYNIAVEEDESYVADGTVVHNCSGFATGGLRDKGWGKAKAYSTDKVQQVDDLFFEFARLLKDIQPKVFVAENVRGLVSGKAQGYYLQIHRALQAAGYTVENRLIDAQQLGVPQSRIRLIIVGVRNDLAARGLRPSFPQPIYARWNDKGELMDTSRPRPITIAQAFRGLPQPAPDADPKECQWLKPGSKTRQAWEGTDPFIDSGMLRTYYLKRWGKNARYHWFRQRPDRPSVTVTATVPCLLHWAVPRSYTIPEIKRLQSFPDDFRLTGKYELQYERIGRGVPPLLMRHVASRVLSDILEPLKSMGH